MDGLNRPYRRDRTSYLSYIFNSALTGFQVALGAIMPIIRDDLNISLTVASLHFTIMALFGMVGSGLASTVAGLLGRRLITIISLSVSTGALLTICFAQSVVMTLIGGAILGFVAPLGTIVTQAELMDHHRTHRAAALAELSLVVSLAMLVTTIGAGPLVALSGSWRLTLLIPVLVLLTAYLTLPALPFTDSTRTKRVRVKRSMNGLAWLFCLIVVSQSAFEWCYGYLGAEFMTKVGGLSKESAASSMSLYYAGLVLGRVGLVPAVRRYSSYHLLLTSFGTALTGFVLMAGGPSTGLKLAGLFVSGLGISITFPMIINLAGAAFPDATDWIISKLYVAGGMAVAIAPFGIGTLGDQIGISQSFWVLGAIGVIGLLASPLLNRRLADHHGALVSAEQAVT